MFQAVAAYGLSYLFEHTGGNYTILFVIGAGAVIVSLAIDLVTALTVGKRDDEALTAYAALHRLCRIAGGVEADPDMRHVDQDEIDDFLEQQQSLRGSRRPAPITTQSRCLDLSAATVTASAVSLGSIRQLSAS